MNIVTIIYLEIFKASYKIFIKFITNNVNIQIISFMQINFGMKLGQTWVKIIHNKSLLGQKWEYN